MHKNKLTQRDTICIPTYRKRGDETVITSMKTNTESNTMICILKRKDAENAKEVRDINTADKCTSK